MLLLAAAARPDDIEAATVDHKFRTESAAEAEMVGKLCAELGVPHSTLAAGWAEKPQAAVQEKARAERYRLLGSWASGRGLLAIATAHHADDQAETLLMRLNRGSGLRGLAGMRAESPLPASTSQVRLIRPLLSWRRSQLERICDDCDVEPAEDPSNFDDRYERVRIRRGLAEADWLDAEAVERSAGYLGEADVALDWAAQREWDSQVSEKAGSISYRPDAPAEIRRRIVSKAVTMLASEGLDEPLRGRELDTLLVVLSDGGQTTLRGVVCSGDDGEWRFSAAPPRR